METKKTDDITKTISDFAKAAEGTHCQFCFRETDIVGVFIPNDPKKFGGDNGRVFLYCLCKFHSKQPDIQDRVERWILQELRVN